MRFKLLLVSASVWVFLIGLLLKDLQIIVTGVIVFVVFIVGVVVELLLDWKESKDEGDKKDGCFGVH